MSSSLKGSSCLYLRSGRHEGRVIVGEGDLAAQAEQAFQNLHSCLEAAGATMQNVTKMTILVVGLRPEYREICMGHMNAICRP
jgi:enamine deaminase RidA (YjgF/YER057c/UK114 family)